MSMPPRTFALFVGLAGAYTWGSGSSLVVGSLLLAVLILGWYLDQILNRLRRIEHELDDGRRTS